MKSNNIALTNSKDQLSQEALIDALQSQVISLQKEIQEKEKAIEVKEKAIRAKELQFSVLYEKFRLAMLKRFGKQSERISKDQLPIFDELPIPESRQKQIEKADEKITIAGYQRKKKSGRKPLPKELLREEIIYDLSENEKQCSCCHHTLHEFGEDRSEQLEYIPATMKVIVTVKKKYACRHCETVKSARTPKQIIPKSIARPSLLAHVIVSKYEDHLPFYRQEKIFKRLSIDVARHTFTHWSQRIGDACEPVIAAMKKQLMNCSYLHADETPVRVLTAESKGYMYVYAGTDRKVLPEEQPNAPNRIILYDYHQSRRAEVPETYLSDFNGFLQTDGYAGYNSFLAKEDVTSLCCMAHARRKFFDVVKLVDKSNGKPGAAHEGLNYIKELYKIEKEARINQMTCEQRKALRQEKAKPLLDEFKEWLNENIHDFSNQNKTKEAISYTLKHWDRLSNYIDDGRLEIDNNAAERAIRPFAIGRKNWLFCGHERGAKSQAMIYSLIETCRANKINSFQYLAWLFEKLPLCRKGYVEDYQKLTPMAYLENSAGNKPTIK